MNRETVAAGAVVQFERRAAWLSYVALGVGIAALGLAVVPGIAMGQPLPLLDQIADREEERSPRGMTVSFGKLSFTVGGDEQVNDGVETDAARARRVRRGFDLSAAGVALCGLVLGPVSWVREKRRAVSGSAMGICCLALVWQYLIIGLAIGVAAAVLLMVLGSFST